MLNPEINPLYRQVLYDGEKRTHIRTLQNHKNQITHTEQYQWNKDQDCQKNSDKITSCGDSLKSLFNPSYTKMKKPDDHQIFSPNAPIKQSTIPYKYQQRYFSQNALFPTTSPRVTESTARLIGKYILNDGTGNFKLPPIQPPSETYRNRSQVFFG